MDGHITPVFYNRGMHTARADTSDDAAHLANVAQNLQLIADLAYGDVALAVARDDGSLSIAADARPMTALAAMASTRAGHNLSIRDDRGSTRPRDEAALDTWHRVHDLCLPGRPRPAHGRGDP
jgi:hypothetical protein